MQKHSDGKRRVSWPWTDDRFVFVLVVLTVGLAVVATTFLVKMPMPQVGSAALGASVPPGRSL
jgi:uncharacterized membrane protein